MGENNEEDWRTTGKLNPLINKIFRLPDEEEAPSPFCTKGKGFTSMGEVEKYRYNRNHIKKESKTEQNKVERQKKSIRKYFSKNREEILLNFMRYNSIEEAREGLRGIYTDDLIEFSIKKFGWST